jgi:hypothetical protein
MNFLISWRHKWRIAVQGVDLNLNSKETKVIRKLCGVRRLGDVQEWHMCDLLSLTLQWKLEFDGWYSCFVCSMLRVLFNTRRILFWLRIVADIYQSVQIYSALLSSKWNHIFFQGLLLSVRLMFICCIIYLCTLQLRKYLGKSPVLSTIRCANKTQMWYYYKTSHNVQPQIFFFTCLF